MRAAANKNNILNIGGKTNYQNQNNQNNPDYFYEDLRPKMEQSNTIPQLVSLKIVVYIIYEIIIN